VKHIIITLLSMISKERAYLKDLLIVLIVTRAIYIEYDLNFMLAEIIGAIIALFAGKTEDSNLEE